MVIERSRVLAPLGMVKKYTHFGKLLFYIATVHPAVNGHLAHRTATEIVRIISHQRQVFWLYAHMRDTIEFE